MNSTLNDALVSLIQSASSGLQAGVSFLQAQIPDVIHQLLLFNLVRDMSWIGFNLLGLLLPIAFTVFCWKTRKREIPNPKYERGSYHSETITTGFNPDGPIIVFYMLGGVASVGFTIMLVVNCFNYLVDAFEIWLAPKVWLIEYAATLIHK